MIVLAHARKSDISLHLMSKDHVSQAHLIDVSYSTQDLKRAIVGSLTELTQTNPGVKVTEFDNSCHVEVNATLELPIVAEIIADYWKSLGFIVTCYAGAHNYPQEVETFLTTSMKYRYAKGKYTYPYGASKPDAESESES